VLAGNALYFVFAAPHLPGWAMHKPFQADLGLLVDFLICLAIYLGLGRLLRRSRDGT
jgi:hypothetical protein